MHIHDFIALNNDKRLYLQIKLQQYMRKLLAMGLFAVVSFNATHRKTTIRIMKLRSNEKYGYIIDKSGKR
jgi:hypothetical protein